MGARQIAKQITKERSDVNCLRAILPCALARGITLLIEQSEHP